MGQGKVSALHLGVVAGARGLVVHEQSARHGGQLFSCGVNVSREGNKAKRRQRTKAKNEAVGKGEFVRRSR